MDKPTIGMVVKDVSDRHVGVLREVQPWGLCVELPQDPTGVWLIPAAVFNVDMRTVTLVCNRESLARYESNKSHPASA